MAHIPQIEFYKTRQFGDKLNMTFVFLRENAGPYLKSQILIAGPILLLLNILVNRYSMSLIGFNPIEATANDILNMANIYGLVLLNAFVTGSIMPAIAYGYMRAYQEKEPNEINISTVTMGLPSKIFNLLGFNILVFIIVGFGLLFFIIPGIYLFVVLSFGSAIIIFEDSNPIDAISRSFLLIRGKWWSTFGLIIVATFIGYLVNMLFGLPRIFMMGFDAFSSAMEGAGPDEMLREMGDMSMTQQVLGVVFSVFETFGAILTYSLTYLALAFQYFNLVERRESRGLMSDIAEMDNGQDNSADEETY